MWTRLPGSYQEFLRTEASLWFTATGAHREQPIEEWVDGERFAWMEFEHTEVAK